MAILEIIILDTYVGISRCLTSHKDKEGEGLVIVNNHVSACIVSVCLVVYIQTLCTYSEWLPIMMWAPVISVQLLMRSQRFRTVSIDVFQIIHEDSFYL